MSTIGAPATSADLDKRLNSLEDKLPSDEEVKRVNATINAETARQENKSRTVITNITMAVYTGSLVVLGVLLLVLAFCGRMGEDSIDENKLEAIKQGLEILKIGVLPITTLVIGYYIGQRRDNPHAANAGAK